MVLAPEHKLVNEIGRLNNAPLSRPTKPEVGKKSDLERTELAKEKQACLPALMRSTRLIGRRFRSGCRLRPRNLWTGAIMAVPGHDERDMEFATNSTCPSYRSSNHRKEKNGAVMSTTASLVNSANKEISLNGLSTNRKRNAKSPNGLRPRALAKRRLITNCATGFSAGSVIGESHFRSFGNGTLTGKSYHEALPESALPLQPPPLDDYKTNARRATTAGSRKGLGKSAGRVETRDEYHAAVGGQLLVLPALS